MATDYYDRYNFQQVQKIIVEDRRIRMNFWASKVLNKPPETFVNPKLLMKATKQQMKDVDSIYFTLNRTTPIKIKDKEGEEIKNFLIEHPIFLKDKLTDFEIATKINKLFNKNFFKVSDPNTKSDITMMSNMILMRNFELSNFISKNKKQ